MKQTAVEWLVKIYLQTNKIDNFDIDQAKAMEKEQLEKELISFFLFIRNSGEHFIGMPIEQFVKKYLEGK